MIEHEEIFKQGENISRAFASVFGSQEGVRVLLYMMQKASCFEGLTETHDPIEIVKADTLRRFMNEVCYLANLGPHDFRNLLIEARRNQDVY